MPQWVPVTNDNPVKLGKYFIKRDSYKEVLSLYEIRERLGRGYDMLFLDEVAPAATIDQAPSNRNSKSILDGVNKRKGDLAPQIIELLSSEKKQPAPADHEQSEVKIFSTTDYSLFNLINGNRQLNTSKIKRIRNDITAGLDVLRYCPILVKQEQKGKYDIIDGQHRFAVAKAMKRAVWYIIVEDFTLHDIAKINSNTEKWRTRDYINCFLKQGNTHYEKLQNFINTYKFPFSKAVTILMHGKLRGDGGMGGHDLDLFKRGKFEAKYETESIRFAEACKLFEAFQCWNSRPFILAIETILKGEKCDFAELVDKFKNDPTQLQRCGSPKEYLSQLEEIYNYRMRSRRVIY